MPPPPIPTAPTLAFQKQGRRLSRLHDELLAAVPALAPQQGQARARVDGAGAEVRVTLAVPVPVPPRTPPEPAVPAPPDVAALPAAQAQAQMDAYLERFAAWQQTHTAWQQEVGDLAGRQAEYEQAVAAYQQEAAAFTALEPQIAAVVAAHDPDKPESPDPIAQAAARLDQGDPLTAAEIRAVLRAVVRRLRGSA